MANNRFYITCKDHSSEYMFAKDWGEHVNLYIEKDDFPARTQSFEEWLTEHRFCDLVFRDENSSP